MWLFVLFLCVPLIEIALFIQVGGAIGLWPTLLIVVVTALIGTALVRQQGTLALGQVRQSFNTMQDPTEPLANGAMILFSGALLLTPGFFTDAVGFALLMPPFRAALFRYVRSRVTVHHMQGGAQHPRPRDTVIDGDFETIHPKPRETNSDRPPSGWTQH